MIDISENILQVRQAKYGIEVRETIANGLQAIQDGANALSAEKLDAVACKGPNLFNPDKIKEGKKQLGSEAESDSNYFITEKIAVNTAKRYIKFAYANENGKLVKTTYAYCALFYSNGVIDLRSNGNGAVIIKDGEKASYFIVTFTSAMKEKQLYIAFADESEDIEGQAYAAYEAVTVFDKMNETMINAEKAFDKANKNASDINTLIAVKTSRISDIMKPLFADGSNLQIKLIGDSITMGAQGTGVNDNDSSNDLIYTSSSRSYYENTAGRCWANSLRDYLKAKFGCTVKNYGVTGSTSWAILNYIDDIVHDEDDICVVCIGINDRAKTTKEETKNRITSIYDSIISKGKKCILMSEIPSSLSNESKYSIQNYHCEDIDIIYQQIAAEKDIEYISLYKLFNYYTETKNITIESLLSSDGLHPNDSGYDVIFRLITNALGLPNKRIGATW